MSGKRTYLILLVSLITSISGAQCLSGYSWSFSPDPISGHWNSDEQVNVTLSISSQNWQGNAHYLHAVIPQFSDGWDLSTFTPIPPNTCSGDGGFWIWHPGPVTSSASGAVNGAGFYYESPQGGTDNMNPGDNYGDHCPTQESLEFSWTISTKSLVDCLPGMNLDFSANTYSDDQSGGSFLSTICDWDEQAVFNADLECCDAHAGIGSTLNLCSDGPSISLDDLLDTSAEGFWYYGNTSGTSVGSSFDFNPATDPAGDYIFVVEGQLFDCEDQAIIEIIVQNSYTSGTGGTFHICNSGGIILLSDLLTGEDAGGTWKDPFGNTTDVYFSPSNDPGGIYTYLFPANGSCLSSSTQLNIILTAGLNPGLGNTLAFCPCDNENTLISLLTGSPHTWGYWTGPSGNILNDPTFIPGLSANGTYTYHLDAWNCQAQSVLNLSTTPLGNPGMNNAVTLCPSSTPPTSLFSLLNGIPSTGGTWISPTGNVIANGIINPATANSGPYNYRFTCGACSSQAIVQVNLSSTPSLSLLGSITQCNTNPVNLSLSAQGIGPFNLTVLNEAGTPINLSGVSNGVLIPVNSAQSNTYTISQASSVGLPYCGVELGVGASVTIGNPPSASLSATHLLCPGQSLELSPDLSGNGPFQLQVFSSATGLTSTAGPIQSGESFTVYPNTSGSFSITQVNDASTPTCSAAGTGQVNVSFTQSPSASLVGGGTLCYGQDGTAVVDINGSWTSYDLTIETGFGNIYLNDVSDGETIFFPVPISTQPNFPYCLSDVSPSGGSGCQSLLSDTCMHFSVLAPLITYSLTLDCNEATQEATVSFYIQGGAGSFTVNGSPVSGNFFQSAPIPNGSPFNFSVSDAMACGPLIRSGTIECDCSGSAAGTMNYPNELIEICHDEAFIPNYDPSGSLLDGNDVLNIVIHDGSADILGNIIQWILADGSSFALQMPLVAGQTYYLAALVGTDSGDGSVNSSDVCLSFSLGIPIVFLDQVAAELTGISAICEGEQAILNVALSGQGPWEFEILLDGLLFDQVSTSNPSYSFNTLAGGIYTLSNLNNSSCTGQSTGNIEVTEQPLPTASLGSGGTYCEGSSAGPVLNLTGTGPWTIGYTINGDPNSILIGSSMDILPVSISGTYTLTQINDSYCQNSANGSAEVISLPAPQLNLNSSGPACEGETVTVSLEFQGSGPWDLGLGLAGEAQDTLTYTGNSVITFTESGYINTLYLSDSQCLGIQLPQLEVTVDPIPEYVISVLDDHVCEGDEILLSIEASYSSSYSFQLDQGTGAVLTFMEGNEATYSNIPAANLNISVSAFTDMETGCVNTIVETIPIQVLDIPLIDLGPDRFVCSDDTLMFLSSDEGYEYSWSPSSDLINGEGPFAEFSWINIGTSNMNEYVVLSTDNQGCIAMDSLLVTVNPRPYVEFRINPERITTVNPVGNFFNQSPGSNFYTWSVEGETVQTGPWLTYFFPEDVAGYYEVCLEIVSQSDGCRGVLCKDIPVIGELTLYIPNSFSPDGDGLNDEFYPHVLDADLSYYKLLIFDRGGELVFESTNPQERWNGDNYLAGRQSRPGVYPYVLLARDRFGLTAREYRGHVTLIR